MSKKPAWVLMPSVEVRSALDGLRMTRIWGGIWAVVGVPDIRRSSWFCWRASAGMGTRRGCCSGPRLMIGV